MSLLSLVAALLLEQWRPLADRLSLYALLARYATFLEGLFNAGEPRQGAVAWVVAVVASDTRGRWDVGMRGPKGSHFVSFAAIPGQVAQVAAAHVRRTLLRLSEPDVSH